MHKTLFKNSFFAFLKNKLVLVLLIIIIFITSSVYTMMESTSSSFQRSFNEVALKGKLHDFTIKEKFDVSGHSGLSVVGTGPITNKIIADQTKIRVGKSLQAIYLNSTDTSVLFGVQDQKKQTYNFVAKVELGQLFPQAQTSDSLSLGSFKLSFLLKSNVNVNYLQNKRAQVTELPLVTAVNSYQFIKAGKVGHFSNPVTFHWASNGTITSDIINHQFQTNYHFKALASQVEAEQKMRGYVRASTYLAQAQNVHFKIDFNNAAHNLGNAFKAMYQHFDQNDRAKLLQQINQKQTVIATWQKHRNLANLSNVQTRKQEINSFLSKLAFENNQTQYLNYLKNNLSQKVAFEMVNTINVVTPNNKFKLINTRQGQKDGTSFSTSQRQVDKLRIFSGSNLVSPYSQQQMVTGLYNAYKIKQEAGQLSSLQKYDWVLSDDPTIDKYSQNIDRTKHFIYSNSFDDTTSIPITFTDPTAFQTVVSYSYAQNRDLELLDPNIVRGIVQSHNFRTNPEQVFQKYQKSLIWVDKTPYFAIGTGTTPDFSFPIIDGASPLPDSRNEALLFVNDSGYKRIEDAFRSNPRENYLVGKFQAGLSTEAKNQIITDLETYSKALMSWPANIRIISKTNDISEKVILAPQRIAFLQKLNQSIATVSYLTTTLLIIFVAVIMIIVLRKHINSERKTIGILLANGYTKREIAFSMTSITLIVSFIPCLLGYITGYFLQYAFIGVFRNYWTLPIAANSFSWLSMVLTVALPLIGIFGLTILITIIELRGKVVDIIRQNNSKRANIIAVKMLALFKPIGIKNKISIALFMSNITKMFITLVVFTITIISGIVALSLFGKYGKAISETAKVQQYVYKVNLYSPTVEGKPYSALTLEQLGAKGKPNNPHTYQFTTNQATNSQGKNIKANYSYMNIFPKKISDFTTLMIALQAGDDVLKNIVQFKAILNINVHGQVPWNIAKVLMPENQRNNANQQYDKFINFALQNQNNKQLYSANSWWQNLINQQIPTLTQTNWDPYFAFINDTMRLLINDYKRDHTTSLPFFMSFKNVLVDNDDELYTALDVTYNGKNKLGKTILTNTEITGINETSRMINLGQNNVAKLAKFQQSNVIPIVVNQFFKELYGLKLHSQIKMQLKNHAKHKFIQKEPVFIKAQIVGFVNSYDGPKLYTLRDYANAALGWSHQTTDTAFNGLDNRVFNGVYTTNQEPLIFRSLPLYSPSGLYISKLSMTAQDVKIPWIKAVQAANPTVTTGLDYIKNYGTTPFLLTTSNVNWSDASEYTFKTMLSLSGKLIWVIESIALVIGLCFILIISSMIIGDNRRFIATTRVIGYRRREISRMFLAAFIPSIAIAIMIAIPVTIALLTAIKIIIMNFGNVLIPLNIELWSILVATILTITIFVFVYLIAMRKLRGTTMLNAFK